MAHVDNRGNRVTGWGDVDCTVPAMEALKKCFDEKIMCDGKRFFMSAIAVGIQGTTYSSYTYVTLEDIIHRNAKVIWSDGLSVVWGDVVIDDRLNKDIRYRRRPVSELDSADTELFQLYFDKVTRGWDLPRTN